MTELKKASNREIGVRTLLFICASIGTVVVIFIIVYLFVEGAGALKDTSLAEIILGDTWDPLGEGGTPTFGARNLIVGTLLVTLGAMLIAVPIGICAAIFISELAPSRVKSILKSAIEVLAGIPSVVYGFFGMLLLMPFLKNVVGLPHGDSWLAGSIILGVMALPTIISVAEDAINSVPQHYKEASLAMGATRWQTIWRVTVPAARSGILAGVILGMGRAVGETMAVMMVTGNSPILPIPITDITSRIRTITATLGIEIPEVEVGGTHYHVLFMLAVILFMIVLVINTVALYFVKKRFKEWKPKKEGRRQNGIWKVLRQNSKKILVGLLGALMIFVFWTWWGLIPSILIVCIGVIAFFLLKLVPPDKFKWFAYAVVIAATAFILIFLGIIISYIVINGVEALSWDFITGWPSGGGTEGGILPAILGSLFLIGGAILYAAPIGVLAGIYLAEYAKEGKIKRIIETGIDNLNATPSIVFGLFGYAFLVIFLFGGQRCLLAGQLTLALMILPTIIRTTVEAIRAVPRNFREGSLALGATKWETTKGVVLAPAAPSILTGVVLGIGRAAGETAPIMLTAAVFVTNSLPTNPMNPVMALPYHLYYLSTIGSGPEAAINAGGTALVLLIMVLFFYSIAMYARARFRKKKKW